MNDMNIFVKKACSISEMEGCELLEFDGISALLFFYDSNRDLRRKTVILSQKLSKMVEIDFEKIETPDGYIFSIMANGH